MKIQKKDYLPTGRYPIIDQGQEWCAGYTDREDGLFQDVPAYIFGDHTRIIKYTDEPFYLGADGVKLLKLREGIQANPRFFYYALKSQRIPDTGYNRHFKWLKESLYHVPTLNEQTHIADTLDTLSTLITLCETKIFLFDELVKSRFIEMFGESAYPSFKLKDICSKITDGTHKTPTYQANGVPFVSAKNIKDGKLLFDNVKYISNQEYDEIQRRCQISNGDLLLTKSGSLGIPVLVDVDFPFGIFESLAVLKYDREKINGVFLHSQIRSDRFQHDLAQGVKGIAVKHLHLNVIGASVIIVPPLDLQNEFAAFVEQTDKSKLVLRQLLEKQRTLKAALMQEYFAAK